MMLPPVNDSGGKFQDAAFLDVSNSGSIGNNFIKSDFAKDDQYESSGEFSEELEICENHEEHMKTITTNMDSIPKLAPLGENSENKDDDVGVPETTWERWKSKLSENDLMVDDKRIKDDSDEFEILLLAPLGRGVSGSVYLCKVLNNRRDNAMNGFLYAIKIYKTDPVSLSQSNNEMLMIPFVQRISGTSSNSIVPSLLQPTKIRGHPSLIMNLYGPNLFQIIGMRNYTGFPLHTIKTFMAQILKGLVDLEGRGIIHGDIKPENVVISLSRFGKLRTFSEYTSKISQVSHEFVTNNYECPASLDIVLIDWSSSSMGYNQVAPYVQSRFYRAPEVLLRSKYGPSADIWSLGCMAAELFLGSPLFPGGDELDMLRQIQLKLGIMPQVLVKKMGDSSPAKHSNEWKIDPSMYMPGNFEIFLRERSGRDDFDFLAFVNILRLMLQLNPDARITASSAMLHPFITGSPTQQPMRVISRRDSMVDESASSTHSRTRRISSKRKPPHRVGDESSEHSQI